MEVKEPALRYSRLPLTAAEYLEMEKASVEKHEYYRGEMFAMAGAGKRHNLIFSNTFIAVGNQLRGKSCKPFGGDMRIHIPENTLYTYPDISVICGDIMSSDEDEDTFIRPTILIEILLPSTADYDRGGKFGLYRDIPTLKEYVLIDSRRVGIEVWRINSEGYWQLEEYKHLNDVLLIPTVEVAIPLGEIYEGTKLEG